VSKITAALPRCHVNRLVAQGIILAELQYHFPMFRACANRLFRAVGAVLPTALVLIPALSPQPVSGLPVTGLYQQRVAVADESPDERGRAFALAFRRMIVKVAGDESRLEHAAIRAAAEAAGDYVQAFAYATGRDEGPPGGQRYLEVQFSAPLINELLAGADIPVWGGNRPSVLVWMALQDTAGRRSLLSAETGPEIIGYMRRFAEERGLPIIFPLLDIKDRRRLSPDAIWAQDERAIRAASDRYDPDSILAGRLLFTPTGELVGLWQFLFMGEAEVFDGFASGIEDYLAPPLARVTRDLAEYFALDPGGPGGQPLRLRVDGIRDFADYSALIAYVDGIGLVRTADVVAVDGERLELELDLLGDAGQLFNLISLDRDLRPVGGGQTGASAVPHYRWMR